MTDTTTTTQPGRRRATGSAIFGDDFPEHAAPQLAETAASPIEDAFAFATDRLDRLEHLLGSLNATVMRAGSVLEPILTDGSYGEPDTHPTSDDETTPEDRRSTLTKRITRLGLRADHLADAAAYIERRIEAMLDAAEL